MATNKEQQVNEDNRQTVEVFVENSGRALYYPANETAADFLELMGKRKCFDVDQLKTIKKLGFKVMQVPNPKLQETKEL